MKLIDLAQNIWFGELDETTNTSTTKILNWFISNIGLLNDALSTSHVINGTEASPELTDDEAVIFGLMYLHRYYQRLIQTNLNATQYDWSEITEADSTIRRVSKNEIAKSYRLLANDTKDYLNKLIESWKKWQCVPASLHSEFFTSIVYTKKIEQP